MKRPIIFLESGDEELSAVKFLLAVLNGVVTISAFFLAQLSPLWLILFPVFVLFLLISIWYFIKSIKNKTIELFSLYFLPLLIATLIGIQIDSINTKKVNKNLLEAQSYVEKYIEENHSLPEKTDTYLKELGVQIQGTNYHENYLKAQEYSKEYYEKNGKYPEADDQYLMELDANHFNEYFDYTLNAYRARIRRGDKEVYLYPCP